MLVLLKILTFPIWFPFKVLWALAKFAAVLFALVLAAAAVYLILHVV